MIEISGRDKLSRDMDEAQEVLSLLDGELGTVSFNPSEPASIEAAIQQAESMIDDRLAAYSSNPIIGPMIDDRLAAYSSNPIIGPMIDGLKEQYRNGIIERAAAARLGEEQE